MIFTIVPDHGSMGRIVRTGSRAGNMTMAIHGLAFDSSRFKGFGRAGSITHIYVY